MPARDVRAVESVADVRLARDLISHQYLSAGYICHASKTVHRWKDDSESDILVAEDQGVIVSTLTIFPDDSEGLPLKNTYEREVAEMENESIVEFGCFASESDSIVLIIRLMNLAFQRCLFRGVDDILIAVHPKHVRFYRRLFGFSVIAGPRSYSKANGHPAMMLKCGIHLMSPTTFDRFCGETFPIEKVSAQPQAAELLRELSRVMPSAA